MSNLHISPAPHIHSGAKTSRIMLDVVISLLPAVLASVLIFGVQSLLTIAVCIVSCVAAEALFNVITKKKQTVSDLSAVVTGLILALNLSNAVPIWQCVVGSVFAIVVVKCLFGGLGCNIVNPAIGARVFMLLAFSGTVTAVANPVSDLLMPGAELTAGATPLAAETAPGLLTLLVGVHGGTLGETCAIALVLGFIYLLCRKVIRWHLPVTFIATVFVASLIATGSVYDATAQILSGGLLLGAIFMATDYVTTPITTWGRVLFGLGAGLITFYIRFFGGYPEGVSIAILCMNLVSPLLEKWTRKTPLGGV